MPCRRPLAPRPLSGPPSRDVVGRRRPGDAHGRTALVRQLQLPVKVIVFKNDALAFVELEMKAAGILEFTTDLQNPDFAKIAEAAGLPGADCGNTGAGTTDDLTSSRTQGTGARGSVVHRQELSMPPTITLEQMTGFSLFMLKAVLSGAATRSSTWPRSICFGSNNRGWLGVRSSSDCRASPQTLLRYTG